MRERLDLNSVKPSKARSFIYSTAIGRPILRIFSSRRLANMYAGYLNSRLSKIEIKRFVKKYKIDLSEYKPKKYRSFNEFFTREIRPECRPVDTEPTSLIAPCDGNLTVFTIDENSIFRIKGFDYSLNTLLRNEELAKQFEGGICLVFRLTVKNYHRYGFFDGGTAEDSVFIAGRLHAVRPDVLGKRRVFSENCREYTLLHTDNFGDALQIEVGAMFVGRIVNNGKKQFVRGEEKGFFEFGGSTIIVLLKKGVAEIESEILENTHNNFETIVKYGERIGCAVQK